jgi:hypothetical protein
MALGEINSGNDSEFIPSNLNTVLTTSTDSDEVVMNTSVSGYYRKPLSALWSWIKSKIASEVIPDVVTIQTPEITITTDWQDIGISKDSIPTGTYAVQFYSDECPIISIYQDIFSGIMSWYAEETNSEESTEVTLHYAGHAPNSQRFYLRTTRSPRTTGQCYSHFHPDRSLHTDDSAGKYQPAPNQCR